MPWTVARQDAQEAPISCLTPCVPVRFKQWVRHTRTCAESFLNMLQALCWKPTSVCGWDPNHTVSPCLTENWIQDSKTTIVLPENSIKACLVADHWPLYLHPLHLRERGVSRVSVSNPNLGTKSCERFFKEAPPHLRRGELGWRSVSYPAPSY